jgi:hypothetical protein
MGYGDRGECICVKHAHRKVNAYVLEHVSGRAMRDIERRPEVM